MANIENIPDIKELKEGLAGEFDIDKIAKNSRRLSQSNEGKIVKDLESAILASGLKDGMTISFHHHFRNGDYVLNMVMDKIAEMGFKDLTIAASSLQAVHKPLIEHIKNGVVTRIETSGMRGDLAEEISRGLMDMPVVFRSHGSRAYAIEQDMIHIDVAFLGAVTCDLAGNANGFSNESEDGVNCGSLGYAMTDARYADKVVILTDNIVEFPNVPCAILQTDVDYVVKVDSIGDANGIMSGATRYTKNPKELIIAETTANVIEASGKLKEGFSMQMGSGGASLATARFLKEKMKEKNIHAAFAVGGITGQIAKLHEEGWIKKLIDVQSFDLGAAASVKNNLYHQQVSGLNYASPGKRGAATDQLDLVILSALEVDTDFNVNVLTGSDGVIRGAIGGHQDTAAGADVSIVVCPLTRGRIACVVDELSTVVTPGKTVDIVVTDQGVAVNPLREDLIKDLREAGMKLCTLESLRDKALSLTGKPEEIEYTDKVVGIVTYRDGSVLDLIYQVKE